MTHEDEGFFIPTLRREVDDFFRQALRPLARRAISVETWNPQLDVSEEEDRFILEIDLPGVQREDITLEVRGRTLLIGGTRKIIRRTVGARFSHIERVSGSFLRSVPLPAEVDAAGIGASLDKGILTVELPKKKRAAL